MSTPAASPTGAPVTLERLPDHVALVTLNRPQARNAIDAAVARTLEAIVDETERDDDHGLVHRLASADRVVEEAVALARRITRNAPIAVRESLRIARQAFDLDEAGLRALSAQSRARIAATEDFREGPRAFIEKRDPRWTGR